ncbi:MAG: TatD family hydrolase [Desulfocapsaceae bacterium]|nr:TatD family hydrolase [Desulfocapsaceae bacterium]
MTKRQKTAAMPTTNVPLVDTHCHLDMDAYADDIETVLQRSSLHNIGAIVSVGIDVNSSIQAVELAKQYTPVSAAIGIHPHDVDNITIDTFSILADIAENNKEYIVAYGEIGLDYAKRYSSPEAQRLQFRNQLSLANDLHLPVIIHDRDAHEDILTILRESGPLRYGGIMHCFSGDAGFAYKIIDLGLHISIPGTVTFKNATAIQDVAAKIPLNSMLLETDGPFLTPHPFRGKRNEPPFVLYTALKVAEIRDISLEELAKQTSLNAKAILGLHHLSL